MGAPQAQESHRAAVRPGCIHDALHGRVHIRYLRQEQQRLSPQCQAQLGTPACQGPP